MDDFILKVLHRLSSAKTASKCAAGPGVSLAILYFCYRPLAEEMQGVGVARDVVLYLLIVLGLGIGVLLVEATIFIYQWVMRAKRRRRARIRIEADQTRAAKILPNLPDNQIWVLAAVAKGYAELDPHSSAVNALRREKWIGPVHRIEDKRILYELRPDLRSVVAPFVKEHRDRFLRKELTDLPVAGREFLKLFTVASSAPEHDLMSSDVYVYSAVMGLINRGVLYKDKSAEEDQLCIGIYPEAIPIIQELVVDSPLQRTDINVDFGNVPAPANSGGGASNEGGRCRTL